MEEKLRILMQNENLTASRLAEILEVQPAAISHILRGRNKPSFELVCKLVNRFPRINPHWLLGDAEEIYLSGAGAISSADRQPQEGLSTGLLFDVSGGALNGADATKSDKSNISAAEHPSTPAQIAHISSDVARIIVVYKDNTFEELRPR